ncbi:TetR/AcrR family transcriptional regulator [Mycolicibacterium frederiksbergense]|uniref:TetR/AcrR family transcriptional regulator n=2 Tax=Mycolicibacterium frederiksbergense TaxID=117567 RepID=A0A6H0SA38_9MYCO|nr:TetR/AcrR family transcriptional regulator [Mycolicibacterium frederiksbergense]
MGTLPGSALRTVYGTTYGGVMPRSKPHVGDPVRLSQLLWSHERPVGRSGLSLGMIVGAGTAVARREGADAITMRRVAAELEVAAMSLYSHIPGKAELLELMLDACAAAVYEADDLPAARPDRRAAALFVAERNFDVAVAQPWTLEIPADRLVPGPGTTAKYEAELAVFDGVGLTDVQMDHALTGLLGLASAMARHQVGLVRARAASDRDDNQWWQQVGPALATAMRGREFPLAARVGTAASLAANASADPRAALDYTAGLLLDGLAASGADL